MKQVPKVKEQHVHRNNIHRRVVTDSLSSKHVYFDQNYTFIIHSPLGMSLGTSEGTSEGKSEGKLLSLGASVGSGVGASVGCK